MAAKRRADPIARLRAAQEAANEFARDYFRTHAIPHVPADEEKAHEVFDFVLRAIAMGWAAGFGWAEEN